MRYLKSFNENMKPPVSGFEGLEEFCKDNLAYIIDEDFKVKVTMPSHKDQMTLMDPKVKIEIHKFNFPNYKPFNWVDIKDDVIPFLELLKTKYHFNNLITFTIEYWTDINSGAYLAQQEFSYKYDSVIEDDITLEDDIEEVLSDGSGGTVKSLIKIEINKKY